jgi:hypothetical protein
MVVDRYEIVIKLPANYGEGRAEQIAESLVRGRGTLSAEVWAVGVELPDPQPHEVREYVFTAEAR